MKKSNEEKLEKLAFVLVALLCLMLAAVFFLMMADVIIELWQNLFR